jgi:hypothetical protein
LHRIADQHGGLFGPPAWLENLPGEIKAAVETLTSHGVELPEALQPLSQPPGQLESFQASPAQPRIDSITSLGDFGAGRLLTSPDSKATLVVIGLTSQFLETRNGEILADIEQLLVGSDCQPARYP